MALPEQERRSTIVNEIEYWRRSKLLPEQYCDFLQNLYLDDVNERPKGTLGGAIRRIRQATRTQWMFVFGIFALICLVILYFSAFPLPLQIAIAGAGTTGFVALAGWLRDKDGPRSLLAMMSGTAYLFGTGAAILELHGWRAGAGPLLLLAVCAVLCIVCGLALRLAFIHWFGWLALIALYARMLDGRFPDPSWAETELFWVPAAFLFWWLSWFLQHRHKSAASACFATGLVVWFMPEVQAALAGWNTDWMQWGLLGKIVLAGIGMYRFREHWMEWVA